jgi:hypothetical protein
LPHHLDEAPAPIKYFDTAPAPSKFLDPAPAASTPAPTLLWNKPTFFLNTQVNIWTIHSYDFQLLKILQPEPSKLEPDLDTAPAPPKLCGSGSATLATGMVDKLPFAE